MILLDVMMPGMDGWQVFEQLLQDESTAKIPIVFLTARAELRDQARGLELGGVDYVTKPFNPLDLAPLDRGPRSPGSSAARSRSSGGSAWRSSVSFSSATEAL